MIKPVGVCLIALSLVSLHASDAAAGWTRGKARVRRPGKTRVTAKRVAPTEAAGQPTSWRPKLPAADRGQSQAQRQRAELRPDQRAKLAISRVEEVIAAEIGGSWKVTARPAPMLDDAVHSVTGYGLTMVKAKNQARRGFGVFKKDSQTRFDVLITREGRAIVLDTDAGSRPYRALNWFVRRLPKVVVGLGKSKGVRAGVAGGVPTVGLAGSATLVVATTLAGGLVGASQDNAERKQMRRAHDGAVQRTAEAIQRSRTPLDIHDAYGIYQAELDVTADIVGAKPMDEAAFAVALRAKGF